MECKRRGNVCVTVAHGTPCLGPVTHAGCGALCPSYDRGCYGCFGHAETTNTVSLARRLRELDMSERDVARVFATFNAAAPAFAEQSARHTPPATGEDR
jgi:coenzyme F420-reducing hydrogenase gamma subunit